MWIADKVLLHKFMRSQYWTEGTSSPWGVREMAASSIQFVDVPDNFFSAWVVPIENSSKGLCPSPLAAIRHGSNKGPHIPNSPWGRLSVCDAFISRTNEST